MEIAPFFYMEKNLLNTPAQNAARDRRHQLLLELQNSFVSWHAIIYFCKIMKKLLLFFLTDLFKQQWIQMLFSRRDFCISGKKGEGGFCAFKLLLNKKSQNFWGHFHTLGEVICHPPYLSLSLNKNSVLILEYNSYYCLKNNLFDVPKESLIIIVCI